MAALSTANLNALTTDQISKLTTAQVRADDRQINNLTTGNLTRWAPPSSLR